MLELEWGVGGVESDTAGFGGEDFLLQSGWPSAFGGGLEGFGGAELSAVEEFLLVLTWWVFTMVGVALCSGSGAEVWLLSRRFCALLIYCPFGIGRRVFPMSILAISGNFGSTGYGGSFGASKEEGG